MKYFTKKFPGICDAQGNCLTNLSGRSSGVHRDDLKLAGGRVDLDNLCANNKCEKDESTGQWATRPDGTVILKIPLSELVSSKEFLASRSPMGGWQGDKGKFGFFDYVPGSLWDKVAEAYAGTHDTLNSGTWYDKQGNIKSGVAETTAGKIGNVTNYSNVILATPFAISVLLPPEVWNALVVSLKAKP